MTEKMNALRNKKGFTLIEMLVVIAIIAVLVAIVIPVVGNSTNKAACATNAANLRSIKAEVTTAYLTGDTSKYTFAEASGDVTVTHANADALPKSKKTTEPECAANLDPVIDYNTATKEFDVTYDGKTIENFANEAAGETTAAVTP